MTKKSEAYKFEIKCEKVLDCVVKKIKIDFKNMIKWLFFYKPDGTGDEILHIIEALGLWFMFTRTVFGL